MPTWLGDCVMATPVLRALAMRTNPAPLWVAIPAPLCDLLDGATSDAHSPLRIVPIHAKGLLGPARAARQMRHTGVPRDSLAVLLPNSLRAALIARVAGFPQRVGAARDMRRALLTHALPAPPRRQPVSAVDWYAELGSWVLGEEITDRRVRLACTSEDEQEAARLLGAGARPYAVLNPGASKPMKRWGAQKFAELADALAARCGLSVVVTGSPAERELTAQVCALATCQPFDLAAAGGSLGSLKAVLARAALLVTNDTGTRHIGAAMGTPTVTLFGPTDHRWTTLHDTRERHVLAAPFLPEALVADHHPRWCTMDRISVGDVLAACRALLAR